MAVGIPVFAHFIIPIKLSHLIPEVKPTNLVLWVSLRIEVKHQQKRCQGVVLNHHSKLLKTEKQRSNSMKATLGQSIIATIRKWGNGDTFRNVYNRIIMPQPVTDHQLISLVRTLGLVSYSAQTSWDQLVSCAGAISGVWKAPLVLMGRAWTTPLKAVLWWAASTNNVWRKPDCLILPWVYHRFVPRVTLPLVALRCLPDC